MKTDFEREEAEEWGCLGSHAGVYGRLSWLNEVRRSAGGILRIGIEVWKAKRKIYGRPEEVMYGHERLEMGSHERTRSNRTVREGRRERA